jgi:hypothetical protein
MALMANTIARRRPQCSPTLSTSDFSRLIDGFLWQCRRYEFFTFRTWTLIIFSTSPSRNGELLASYWVITWGQHPCCLQMGGRGQKDQAYHDQNHMPRSHAVTKILAWLAICYTIAGWMLLCPVSSKLLFDLWNIYRGRNKDWCWEASRPTSNWCVKFGSQPTWRGSHQSRFPHTKAIRFEGFKM